MPDRRRAAGDVPERIERLNRAVDRVAAGQSVPLLHDDDLQELVSLAARLRNELPRDLPDPAFRADLKACLTDPMAARRSAGARRHQRFPYVAAASSIAAVLVAAIIVGTVAVRANRENTRNEAIAVLRTASGTSATAALGLATSTISTSLTAPVPGSTSPVRASTPAFPTSAATTAPSGTADTDPTPQPKPSNIASGTSAPTSTSKPAQTMTAEATVTSGALLAEIPPVDEQHLEPGPVPAASGGGDPPSSEVTVTLATALPEFAESATLYYLAPPAEDPIAFVTRIGSALDMHGDVTSAPDVTRKYTQYFIGSSTEGQFVWTPDTGAFQFSLPASNALPAVADTITEEVAVQSTLDWLDSIGYPADDLNAPPRAEAENDGATWSVQLWTDNVPWNSFGHPLGVRIFLDSGGHVSSGTGFWLAETDKKDVPILSAEEAWQAIAARKGYWSGGEAASSGGEFRITTLSLGYTLTADDESGELIYQPTIIAEADYVSPNGETSSNVRIYLRAARSPSGGMTIGLASG